MNERMRQCGPAWNLLTCEVYAFLTGRLLLRRLRRICYIPCLPIVSPTLRQLWSFLPRHNRGADLLVDLVGLGVQEQLAGLRIKEWSDSLKHAETARYHQVCSLVRVR